MSYVALVTNRFDEVTRFYGELLGFPIVDQWDRSNARGRRFDTGGMRLEILDNKRKQHQLKLGEPSDKLHIVVEVDDIDEAKALIKGETPAVQNTSWGANLFQIHDPDGVPVTFLQWTKAERSEKQ
jgi:catechol 2,3-dioxygenase-like lactoylglutathione lyase family enzyme